MKVVFVSNYFNHQIEGISLAFHNRIGDDYVYVATTPFPEFRAKVGLQDMNKKYPWVLCSFESEEKKREAIKLINDADFVLFGSASPEYIKERASLRKPIFRCSERIYKDGTSRWKFLFRIFKHRKMFNGYKNQFLLCASAYSAYDYSRSRAFVGKTYKWGYFPETIKYDSISDLIDKKQPRSILWVGRFLPLKHPEFALKLMLRLKNEGINANLRIIGAGEMDGELKKFSSENGLDELVEFKGSVPLAEVRKYMEDSEIFLFTSNKQEGWGSVLNESMNSGCAVVASHAAGSTPFIVNDNINAMIYQSENFEDFYQKVKYLLVNDKERKKIQKNAYHTIVNEWNANTAVDKLLGLFNEIKEGKKIPDGAQTGVCSKAKILKDNWYKPSSISME